MTAAEMSVEFDVLYNNINSNQAPGITEYEKSTFLTRAQEDIVMAYYSGRETPPFEANEEVTSFLSSLVKDFDYTNSSIEDNIKSRVIRITVPEDVWFKTMESAVIKHNSLMCNNTDEREVSVVPITQDRLSRVKDSPFKGPSLRRVLRLDIGKDIELLSNYPIKSYTLRYLAEPEPIVVDGNKEDGETVDSTPGLSINGVKTVQTCKLHTALHRAIVIKAVDMAKAVWKS